MTALPLDLSAASGVPYYRQVQDQIAALIQSGQLKPGDRLPSVRDLAKDLLVSLITIRRAYSELDQAGLIVRKQGQGTFVAEDVQAASQAQAHADAKAQLRAAVLQARQVGLDAASIMAEVADALR